MATDRTCGDALIVAYGSLNQRPLSRVETDWDLGFSVIMKRPASGGIRTEAELSLCQAAR